MGMGIIIRVYEPPGADKPGFAQVGVTRQGLNIRLVEKLFEAGSFEFSLPTDHRLAWEIRENDYVQIDGWYWGVIEDIRLSATVDTNTLTITGRQLKGIVDRRVTIPPETPDSELAGIQGYGVANGATETCMKHYVQANMACDGKRGIPGLVVAPDLERGIAEDKYMSRHDNLADVLRDLGEASALGYDITPDMAAGTQVFDVIPGVDRSAEQREVAPIIFEAARKNIAGSEYQKKTSDSRNAFYATMSGAKYADEALTLVYYREGDEDEAAGLGRREMHMTISADTPVAGGEYDELRRLALIRAEDYRPAESFTAAVTDSRYRYREDYRMGDTVTVLNREWDIAMHTQLTGMETAYTADGVTRTATFGTAPLNVFQRLRRQIRE